LIHASTQHSDDHCHWPFDKSLEGGVKVRDELRLAMRPSRLHVFDAKTEAAI
jgi:hypothetical protein